MRKLTRFDWPLALMILCVLLTAIMVIVVTVITILVITHPRETLIELGKQSREAVDWFAEGWKK